MAEERIDIKVTDSGSDKAAKGLRAIASEAVKAQKAVNQVSAALGSLPANRINNMATASNRASDATARLAAVEARAKSATDALSAAKAKLAATEAKVAAATKASTAAQGANAAAVTKAATATKLAGYHQANLVAQINDIGVSLASGQNPFIVMIQQGSQLQDLSMRVEGGFKRLAKETLKLGATVALAMAPVIVVGATIGTMFAGLHKKLSDEYPKDVTKGMNLTKEQLEDVKSRTVTFGDTVAATFETLGQDIKNGPMGRFFNWFVEESGIAAVGFFDSFRWGVAGVQALVIASNATITDSFVKMAAKMATEMPKSYNFVSKALAGLVNHHLSGVRAIINAINLIPGIDIKMDPKVTFPDANVVSRAGEATGKTFAEHYREAIQGVIADQDSFIERTSDNAINRARRRAREEAGDPSKARRGRTGMTEEEKREEALRKVNAQLDNEIERMGMLKKEREIQQRFDQIEESLLSRRITLTEAETQAIREKLTLIQSEAKIQAAMDALYDETTKATEDHTIAIEAANRALDLGRISYEDYTKAINKANEAHAQATNPLLEMERAMTSAQAASKLYGDQVQRAAYYEQIRNTLMKEGITLSPQYVAGENAKVDALMRGNAELIRQQQAQSMISSIVDPMKEKENMLANEQFYYDELKRLREENYLNEEQYAMARSQLEYKYQEQRLNDYSDMFGKLAGLSSSGNKELAAIGKAAAVTQATIDGYLAVQKALASSPPPMNYVNAAIAGTMAAAQVANIMSTNVGNFATGGQVMVGGRDGVDKNNINMNVTKGERVTIETPAQQKATDEAIARGQNGVGGDVKVSNINVVDPRFVIDSMDTAAGGRVMFNYIRANKREINAVLGRN